MKILIVTDAWHPQVNGVVRTLTMTRDHLRSMGHIVEMITPEAFKTIPCPTYPEIRLAVLPGRKVGSVIQQLKPDFIHIATEGPLGLAARKFAKQNSFLFTTAYHTRFPEYVRSRVMLPLAVTYSFLRWFHGASHLVMAPTQTVIDDLSKWRVGRPVLWPRGVDLDLFKPTERMQTKNKAKKKPVFIYVGRVSVEKNLEAFLSLDLPGEKHVVGDGPAMLALQARFPETVFHGSRQMAELPKFYNDADVFVFPSKTDTFGLVLLEAMGCGLPVAAYPVTGPIDVIGMSGAGALNHDLREACLEALNIDRKLVRAQAEQFSWQAATLIFEKHLVPARSQPGEYHFSDNPHKSNQGVKRVFAAAKNSLSGLSHAFREESAFRQEVFLAVFFVPTALLLPVSALETALMLITIALVLIVELLNSGIEAAVDRISMSNHGLSKRAKDYGSAAVMIALIVCATTHFLFVWRWLFGG